LHERGAAVLSDQELLALVLNTGAPGRSCGALAGELLERFGSVERLAAAGDAEVLAVRGVGPAKLATLRAALELGCRAIERPLRRGSPIRSSAEVQAHFGPRVRSLRQEVFHVVLLDSRHRVLRTVEVSRGSLNQSLVHPREVFAPALREAAAAIVVVHNHPSGDPTPSREDHEVTRRLAQAGEVLGVPLLDHVIVAAARFTSFADRGWLPDQGHARSRR
jgi:DNA repair protein RadC